MSAADLLDPEAMQPVCQKPLTGLSNPLIVSGSSLEGGVRAGVLPFPRKWAGHFLNQWKIGFETLTLLERRGAEAIPNIHRNRWQRADANGCCRSFGTERVAPPLLNQGEMEMEELSLKEVLLLCRRAEERCVSLVQDLMDRADPADPRLMRLLRRIREEEEEHVSSLVEYEERVVWPTIWHVDEREISRLLSRFFPSLSAAPGPGRMTPERALDFLHSVEKETGRFYRLLGKASADPEARVFFRRIAAREAGHLHHLDHFRMN